MPITLTEKQKEFVRIDENNEPVCYLMDDGSYFSKLVNEAIGKQLEENLELKKRYALLKNSKKLNSTICDKKSKPDKNEEIRLECDNCQIHKDYELRRKTIEMEKIGENSYAMKGRPTI